MDERDLDRNPYTPDEKRIVDWACAKGIGGGIDPIGWFIASYDFAVMQRNEALKALREIRARAQAERYPGTPTETDEAQTGAEKELVMIIESIESIAEGALSNV